MKRVLLAVALARTSVVQMAHGSEKLDGRGAVEGGARFTGQLSSAGVARGEWLKLISTTQMVVGAWKLSRLNVAAGCEAGAN